MSKNAENDRETDPNTVVQSTRLVETPEKEKIFKLCDRKGAHVFVVMPKNPLLNVRVFEISL